MKKKIKITLKLSFFITLLTSCLFITRNEPLLQEAKEIMNNNPDSAWTLLQKASADTIRYSEANMMEYLLLKTEAMNKLFMSLDTIYYMEKVLDYYTSYGNKDDQTQAHYMMGCVYRDRGNSPLALLHYNKAINVADTTQENCNFYVVSKILGQMSDIFHEQQYPLKELETAKKEAIFALKAKDSLAYYHCLELMGRAYYSLGKQDSAVQIAQNYYKFYSQRGMNDYAASALTPIIEYHLKNKEYQKAKECLDKYKKESGLLDLQGNPIFPGIEYYYNYLGWYYKDTNKLDSALICYRKLLNYPNELDNKEASYRGFLFLYSQLGIVDSVKKYARLYAEIKDSSAICNSAKEVSKVQALYDYTIYQNKAIEKEQENKAIWIYLFIASLICLILIISLYFINKRNNKQRLNILQKYRQVVREAQILEKNSKNKIKGDEEQIKTLQNVLLFYQKSNEQDTSKRDTNNLEKELMEQEIVECFKTYARKNGKPIAQEWIELEEAISIFLPSFYQHLNTYSETLSKVDYYICLLTRLAFSVDEISNLLEMKKQNISNKRRKLNALLFNEPNSTKKFDWHIMNM